MENAVDNIESLFNKAEADLNLMQTKLDYQFGNIDATDQQQNPVKLMKKLKDIKDEYAQIAKETVAIQEAQKEFTDFFKSQLMLITESLKALENRTGSPDEDPEVVQMCEQLSSLLGIPDRELRPFSDPLTYEENTASNTNETFEDGACASTNSLPANFNKIKKSDSDSQQTTEKPDDAPNMADLRMNGDKFVEVSKEEFMSVSELIRLRVKLEDVNKVYRSLWKFFKEDKNTGMLTPKEMNTMGLRVTGATGQAKLKVLRALKICQINKSGDVSLV